MIHRLSTAQTAAASTSRAECIQQAPQPLIDIYTPSALAVPTLFQLAEQGHVLSHEQISFKCVTEI